MLSIRARMPSTFVQSLKSYINNEDPKLTIYISLKGLQWKYLSLPSLPNSPQSVFSSPEPEARPDDHAVAWSSARTRPQHMRSPPLEANSPIITRINLKQCKGLPRRHGIPDPGAPVLIRHPFTPRQPPCLNTSAHQPPGQPRPRHPLKERPEPPPRAAPSIGTACNFN